jgi:hypothetical protein
MLQTMNRFKRKLTLFIFPVFLCGAGMPRDLIGKQGGTYLFSDSTRSVLKKPMSFTSSNLPIIVITTENGRSIPDSPKINADMGIIYNGEGARNNLSDPFNHFNGRIGIEMRGNATQSFPKKPYLFETRDATGKNLNVSLLGLPEENDWALIAAYIDKTFLRDPLAYRMSRMTGRWAPRTVYCELVLNGQYQGLYILTEKLKRDKNRVDIAEMDSTDISGEAVTGGYIYEVSQAGPEFGERRRFIYPGGDAIRPEQAAYIRNYDDGFRNIMTRSTYADPNTGYPAWIDVDSFIDEILVQEACKNSDAYGWSSHFFKDRSEKLQAGPVWDFDQSLSNSTFNDGPNYSEWIIEKPDFDGWLRQNYPPFWIKLFREPAFKEKLSNRWESLRKGPFHTDSLIQFIDQTAANLNEAQERNFQKWPILGVEIWRSTPGWKERNAYQKEVDYLKAFLANRLNWMDDQLRSPDTSSVKGLVAYYTFEEGRGSVVKDQSGNGLDGVMAGGTEWTQGIRGGGVYFDGVDSYVNLGVPHEFDIEHEITLAAWVAPMDLANGEENEWIDKGDHSWALKEKGDGNFEFFIYDGDWFAPHYMMDQTYGTVWNHFAGTFDGMTLKMYVNGDLVQSMEHEGLIALSTNEVHLGHNSEVVDRFFKGRLDEVVIYNKALTDEEIKSIHEFRQLPTGVEEKKPAGVKGFVLRQNYPNPFNPSTTITYSVGTPGVVCIKVVDLLGREVGILVNEKQSKGDHSVVFDAAGLPSGVYFINMTADGRFSGIKKMLLMR